MVRPLGNRLVVRRWPEVEQTESGLWLPSDAREKPQLGDVLAVGPGKFIYNAFGYWDNQKGLRCIDWPIDIRVSEVVVFAKMVSRDHEYLVDGERLLILPYDTIYCAIQGIAK